MLLHNIASLAWACSPRNNSVVTYSSPRLFPAGKLETLKNYKGNYRYSEGLEIPQFVLHA